MRVMNLMVRGVCGCVKESVHNYMSYTTISLTHTAECCLSLLDLIGPNPVNVKCELIHQGLSVGEME